MVRLAQWRYKGGLLQQELAEVSGARYVTIAGIEAGVFDPRLSTFHRLGPQSTSG
jgi:predicted transcriptional regulator